MPRVNRNFLYNLLTSVFGAGDLKCLQLCWNTALFFLILSLGMTYSVSNEIPLLEDQKNIIN